MIRVLYARDRIATPWKNGGGTTTEVAIFPPGANLNAFDWRVSIADVVHSGPFSLFPGIDRRLAMLKGRVSLAIAGRDAVVLSADGPPIAFPGDVATETDVLDGPATDLNVMTRRKAFRATMTQRRCEGAVSFGLTAQTTFVFPLAATTILHNTQKISLERGDALLSNEVETIAVSPAAASYWIEIFPVPR